jgi:hypothetical protein
MAVFTKSATTLTVVKGFMSPTTSPALKILQLEIVLSSQGGATNFIAADQLGFQKILRSSMAQKSDDALALPTAPSYAGTKLFFYNPAQATDATRDDPADVSGTFRLVVEGL